MLAVFFLEIINRCLRFILEEIAPYTCPQQGIYLSVAKSVPFGWKEQYFAVAKSVPFGGKGTDLAEDRYIPSGGQVCKGIAGALWRLRGKPAMTALCVNRHHPLSIRCAICDYAICDAAILNFKSQILNQILPHHL
jgi:hypothetical protein